jgi:hypothetical protein
MKKIILLATSALLFASTSFAKIVDPDREDVNEKVLKVFEATFPVATDVKWKEYADYYSASFRQNEVQTEVRYDKEGNFISSLRYYREERLPLSILTQIKKKFSSKSIFGVTELTTGNDVAYFVTLEDEKTWTVVKADQSGNLQIQQKFHKG